MSSQTGFGTNMLFQSMNDDLNASLAAADELSKEFNSLLKEASSNNNNKTSGLQTSSTISREPPLSSGQSSISTTPHQSRGSTSDSFSSKRSSSTSTSFRPIDSGTSSSRNAPSPPVISNSPHSSPKINRRTHSPLPQARSDSYSNTLQSPKQSAHTQLASSPGQTSYLLSPYDNSQMGHRSPRQDRGPSPLSFRSPSPKSLSHPVSSTLPRNFARFMHSDEGMQRQKSPGRWNETDLDVSYEKKPHHTYDNTEWMRASLPNSSWRESNLDGPPLALSPKKNTSPNFHQGSYSSLPRNARISVPPDVSPQSHSPFYPQPIVSRISVPPISSQSRQRKPIPLSVILRLQNPHWGAMATRHPRVLGGEGDPALYQPVPSNPREFFHHPVFQPQEHPPELRQPAIYSDALNPGDVDAELERVEYAHRIPVILDNPPIPPVGGEVEHVMSPTPRPLSPTRLQPVVAPEAQKHEIPNLEELLRMRAEIPRALKRRGSVDQSRPLKKASHYQPNQYKHLIGKLFRKKDHHHKGDQGSETNSSSDEDSALPPAPEPPPQTSTVIQHDVKNYHSILRRSSRDRKNSGKRAHLSPLVLLLDAALQGELDTVQRAVQEMTDPSQSNDEGITGLHNSICAGHYNVVEFLVRIGANVSAPDSHGWTPLHCAASCNDRALCEFLVRSGAAVMARTESDGATASQKCDPYAHGFVECESFLKGVEEAMGVENSGVLYALWSYPAQAADELTFREGDMVTILQKPEGSDWWWASLCGREGFVPNNYFGLFPKIRPKSLC